MKKKPKKAFFVLTYVVLLSVLEGCWCYKWISHKQQIHTIIKHSFLYNTHAFLFFFDGEFS